MAIVDRFATLSLVVNRNKNQSWKSFEVEPRQDPFRFKIVPEISKSTCGFLLLNGLDDELEVIMRKFLREYRMIKVEISIHAKTLIRSSLTVKKFTEYLPTIDITELNVAHQCREFRRVLQKGNIVKVPQPENPNTYEMRQSLFTKKFDRSAELELCNLRKFDVFELKRIELLISPDEKK